MQQFDRLTRHTLFNPLNYYFLRCCVHLQLRIHKATLRRRVRRMVKIVQGSASGEEVCGVSVKSSANGNLILFSPLSSAEEFVANSQTLSLFRLENLAATFFFATRRGNFFAPRGTERRRFRVAVASLHLNTHLLYFYCFDFSRQRCRLPRRLRVAILDAC